MKKFRAILAVLMTLTFLAGCGGGAKDTGNKDNAGSPDSSKTEGESSGKTEGDSSKKETLTMWYWTNGIDEGLLDLAEEEFNIDLQAEAIGGDFLAKINTTLAGGGELPDIVLLNDWIISLMPNAGKFLNLLDAPYNAGEIKDLYYDWKWDMAMTPDGSALIALPLDTAPTALFYRADLFEEAGLEYEPEKVAEAYNTWEKMYEIAPVLKEKTGAYLFDNIEMIFMQSLAQVEGDQFFDRSGNFLGDQEHIKKCFDNAVEAHNQGVLMNVNNWTPEWNAAVNDGSIGAFVGGVWMQGVLKDSAPDTSGKWRVAPTPGGPGNQGGSFISVSASSKNPELAYEVIKWLVSPENNIVNFVNRGIFPSTPSAFEGEGMYVADEFFGGQETTRVFEEGAAGMPMFYMAPRHNNFRDFFTNELYLVADQDKDPQQAWDDAVAAAKLELEKE